MPVDRARDYDIGMDPDYGRPEEIEIVVADEDWPDPEPYETSILVEPRPATPLSIAMSEFVRKAFRGEMQVCLDCDEVFDAGEESEEASPEPERCSRCYERTLGG